MTKASASVVLLLAMAQISQCEEDALRGTVKVKFITQEQNTGTLATPRSCTSLQLSNFF